MSRSLWPGATRSMPRSLARTRQPRHSESHGGFARGCAPEPGGARRSQDAPGRTRTNSFDSAKRLRHTRKLAACAQTVPDRTVETRSKPPSVFLGRDPSPIHVRATFASTSASAFPSTPSSASTAQSPLSVAPRRLIRPATPYRPARCRPPRRDMSWPATSMPTTLNN